MHYLKTSYTTSQNLGITHPEPEGNAQLSRVFGIAASAGLPKLFEGRKEQNGDGHYNNQNWNNGDKVKEAVAHPVRQHVCEGLR